jgi:F0F1-type ATP synthase membrane subunit a
MISGTALLTVLVVGLSAATLDWFGAELPILAPILLFLQGLLVACIQAFVFPLLIAIFIKVARMSEDMEAPT